MFLGNDKGRITSKVAIPLMNCLFAKIVSGPTEKRKEFNIKAEGRPNREHDCQKKKGSLSDFQFNIKAEGRPNREHDFQKKKVSLSDFGEEADKEN